MQTAAPQLVGSGPMPIAAQQLSDGIDDETILLLPDGDRVAACEIEKNLLNALPCISHALVFGSKRPILAAFLVLKSSDNSDPNLPFYLQRGFCSPSSSTAPPLLAGDSKSRRGCDIFQPSFRSAARSDPSFRNGLLQGLSAANKLAKSSACLVRKFCMLPAHLSFQNGELNSDGSVSCFASPLYDFL